MRNETITPSRQRFDIPRIFRRIAQRIANAVYGAVQVVIEVYKAVGPKPLLQLLASDDCAGMLKENGEDLERLTAELQLEAALAQFYGIEVYVEIGKSNEFGGLDGFLHRRQTSVLKVPTSLHRMKRHELVLFVHK